MYSESVQKKYICITRHQLYPTILSNRGFISPNNYLLINIVDKIADKTGLLVYISMQYNTLFLDKTLHQQKVCCQFDCLSLMLLTARELCKQVATANLPYSSYQLQMEVLSGDPLLYISGGLLLSTIWELLNHSSQAHTGLMFA